MTGCRTLRVAWDILREQSERIAQMHLEASGQLSDAAFRLNEFIKRQKAERIPVSSSSLDKYSLFNVNHSLYEDVSASVFDFDAA